MLFAILLCFRKEFAILTERKLLDYRKGCIFMKRVISIGKQNFRLLREYNCFYLDKTNFIKEWWEYE